VSTTIFGGLRELMWAWHPAETNLRCSGISRIGLLNPNFIAFIAFEITDRQIKTIYTVWGRTRFLLVVTYVPTILAHPFILSIKGTISFLSFFFFLNVIGGEHFIEINVTLKIKL